LTAGTINRIVIRIVVWAAEAELTSTQGSGKMLGKAALAIKRALSIFFGFGLVSFGLFMFILVYFSFVNRF